ncbi:hypothetical protein MLD38_016352 [Melastoma candidum]|uniref:Uncharacterized protein n=1 Tax=Melastoma candidum TaxID=119954 RepID=A0ACB9RJR0_9MYRT|nr:hypothetical protein MLD38_016352 [Melastoma candidum]
MEAPPPDNKNADDHLPPAAPPLDVSLCSLHPYRANPDGGICASCLKEQLGKLISSSSASSVSNSSFPLHLHRPPSSSSSSSAARSPPSSGISSSSSSSKRHDRSQTLWAKIPGFLYYKKKSNGNCHSPAPAVSDRAAALTFRRSNTAPKRPEHLGRFLDEGILEFSPRKKGFWSFFYLPVSNHLSSSCPGHRHCTPNNNARVPSSATSAVTPGRRAERTLPFPDDISKRCSEVIPEDDDFDGMPRNGNNFDRKVSRSRSVGCGSRSFSGDFFERISTGFGDCTFRRVESRRETNGPGSNTRHRVSSAKPDYRMKTRERCGRIFGGFVLPSSSSSSSSSSYRITTSSSEGHQPRGANGARIAVPGVDALHGRSSRSWGGWVFASPMRAFGRPFRRT